MVEADAPIASESSRMEAAPSRRRRSRIMARRLAGKISTRFDWSSMRDCRDRGPLGGLAEHEKASPGEAVAEADGCRWMFEMGRGAGYDRPTAMLGQQGEGWFGEGRARIYPLGIGRNAMPGACAGEEASHHQGKAFFFRIAFGGRSRPVIGMHADALKLKPVAQIAHVLFEIFSLGHKLNEFGVAHADGGDGSLQSLDHPVAMGWRIIARKLEMDHLKPGGTPLLRHARDLGAFLIDAIIGNAVEAGNEPRAGLVGKCYAERFELRVMLKARIVKARDDARRALRRYVGDGAIGGIFDDEDFRLPGPSRDDPG